MISQTTGPISKTQAPFDSPVRELSKHGAKFDLEVTNDVTGQVKVRMFDFFGLGDIGEHNFDIKHKQSLRIGMDGVTDICKYHFLCFVTIIHVKVTSGHQVKRSSKTISWFRAAIYIFWSDFRKEREK